MASVLLRPVYHNDSAKSWRTSGITAPDDLISAFHNSLPQYAPTRLVSLEQVAKEIGVKAVYLKDEGQRLGLPSFKILGASWGVFKAVAERCNLPLDLNLEDFKRALVGKPVTLFAATEGNHGRAVARMGAILGVQVHIYVPAGAYAATLELIKAEGAIVTQFDKSYDLTVCAASEEAKKSGGILVQDTASPGYEDIPSWIVQGYGTMMREIDEQLGNQVPDLLVAPVGVGSFMQSIVSHFKAPGSSSRILAVEPDTAACLYKSLRKGEPVSIETVPTIMSGLGCGTVSHTAWPLLRAGVDASLTISDFESHQACCLLKSIGISAGPCGASPVAALRRLALSDKAALGLDESSTVVLLCTEGHREYPVPRDVSFEDAQTLTQALVQINSAIPGNGTSLGPGETEIARYVSAWLEHRDIEMHWIEHTLGRPSVVGVVRGAGNGKSLMLNGHIDTVTNSTYEGDALSGYVQDGKLYGRGSADMKGGVAAMMIALAHAKKERLQGDLILTAVADEEDISIGTEQMLAAGWRADAAIVCEPTLEKILIGHKGFVWFDVTIHGLASHGSRFDLGIDAISRAGYFLVELDKYAERLINGPKHPLMGPGSVHASMVNGGEEPASYPASCIITLERRSIVGESIEQLRKEIDDLLVAAAKNVPRFSYDLKVTFSRSPFEIASDHPFVSLVADHIKSVTGIDAQLEAAPFWADSALISDAGIPVVVYGPKGDGLHAKEEWVDLKSVETIISTLKSVARQFCGQEIE